MSRVRRKPRRKALRASKATGKPLPLTSISSRLAGGNRRRARSDNAMSLGRYLRGKLKLNSKKFGKLADITYRREAFIMMPDSLKNTSSEPNFL